jgi:4-hydroxy-2-oxoheptanedioate aldolase
VSGDNRTTPALAERLRSGETVLSGWSAVPDPMSMEALATTAFDAITLDMQHGGHSDESVLRCLPPIISAGKHAVVRIPVGRFDMASRALDFGAEAVIAPMVNSIDDAKRFAAAMKYPPVGERSWGPSFAMPRHRAQDAAGWLASSNERTLAFAMIETRAALDCLNGILEVPGIDGVLVGPADFSIAWTNGATMNPSLEDMMATIADIAARAGAAGKQAAIYVVDPRLVGRFQKMGFGLIALGSEFRYFTLGAEALIGAARGSMA